MTAINDINNSEFGFSVRSKINKSFGKLAEWSNTQNYDAGEKTIFLGKIYEALTSSLNEQPDITPSSWVPEQQNVVHVRTINDFPPIISNEINLTTGVYILEAPITIPDGVEFVCDGANISIRSSVNTENVLFFSGGGVAFRGTDVRYFIFIDMVVANLGTRTLFDISTVTPALSAFSLQQTRIQGFDDLGVVNIPFVALINSQFLFYGKGIIFRDAFAGFSMVNTDGSNASSSNSPLYTLIGSFGNTSINSLVSTTPLTGESIFFFDPAIVINSCVINNVAFKQGLGTFFKSGDTGNIIAFANSGTEPGVKTTVTSAGHGLSNGDDIYIVGDTTVYYDGGYVISNVAANTFDISIVFTVTDTGIWDTGSRTEKDPRINLRNSGEHPESMFLGEYSMSGNLTQTTITTINTFVKIAGITISSANNQRAKMAGNNRILVTNKAPSVVTINCRVTSNMASGGAKDCEIAIFKNGVILGAGVPFVVDSKPTSFIFFRTANTVENDYFEVYIANSVDTTDILVSSMELVLIPAG